MRAADFIIYTLPASNRPFGGAELTFAQRVAVAPESFTLVLLGSGFYPTRPLRSWAGPRHGRGRKRIHRGHGRSLCAPLKILARTLSRCAASPRATLGSEATERTRQGPDAAPRGRIPCTGSLRRSITSWPKSFPLCPIDSDHIAGTTAQQPADDRGGCPP